jgi:hypothetical protein
MPAHVDTTTRLIFVSSHHNQSCMADLKFIHNAPPADVEVLPGLREAPPTDCQKCALHCLESVSHWITRSHQACRRYQYSQCCTDGQVTAPSGIYVQYSPKAFIDLSGRILSCTKIIKPSPRGKCNSAPRLQRLLNHKFSKA